MIPSSRMQLQSETSGYDQSLSYEYRLKIEIVKIETAVAISTLPAHFLEVQSTDSRYPLSDFLSNTSDMPVSRVVDQDQPGARKGPVGC